MTVPEAGKSEISVDITADFSVVDPQRMMCTYGPAQGFLFNHSYMHGMCGSVSTQYAVEGGQVADLHLHVGFLRPRNVCNITLYEG